MKSALLTLIALGMLGAPAFADAFTATIKKEAQACTDALLAQKYDVVADATHARVIEAAGGKDHMIEMIKTTMAKAEEKGIKMKSTEIGTPGDVTKIGAMTVSIVPKHTVMSFPGGKVSSDSALLGISDDDGKTFKFIEIGSMPKEQIEKLFPEFVGKLTLPERKAPVVEKDQ